VQKAAIANRCSAISVR